MPRLAVGDLDAGHRDDLRARAVSTRRDDRFRGPLLVTTTFHPVAIGHGDATLSVHAKRRARSGTLAAMCMQCVAQSAPMVATGLVVLRRKTFIASMRAAFARPFALLRR
jgi:hypothetical protein